MKVWIVENKHGLFCAAFSTEEKAEEYIKSKEGRFLYCYSEEVDKDDEMLPKESSED